MREGVIYADMVSESLGAFRKDVEKMGMDKEQAYEYCVKRALGKAYIPADGLLSEESRIINEREGNYEELVIPFTEIESAYRAYLEIWGCRYKGYGKWTDPSISYTHVYITNRPSAKLVCSAGQSWTTCWEPTQSKLYPLVYEESVYVAYLMRGHKVRGRVFIARMGGTLVMFNLAGTEIHDILLEEILRTFALKKFGRVPEVKRFKWIPSAAEDKEAEEYGDMRYLLDIESLYIAFIEGIVVYSPSSFAKGSYYYKCPSCGDTTLITSEDTARCEREDCEFNKYAERIETEESYP